MIKLEIIKFFKSKKSMAVFAIMLFLAIADSILAVFVESKPEHIVESYGQNNPAFFSLLTIGHVYSVTSVFIYIMPVFLMLAYSDKYAKEFKRGITTLQMTKQGRKKYFKAKITAAFLVPLFLYGVPVLVNLLINTIFLYGGTNFAGLQNHTESQLGKLTYLSITHPYTTYFIFFALNMIVYGLLSVTCQSLCFIFKDNKLAYLIVLVAWIGLYFSGYQISISYVLQPFLSIHFMPIVYSFLAYLPSAFIPLAIAYYCVVNKKDEI